MRTARLAAIAILLIAPMPAARAQGILGRIKQRATEAAEKKAEDKVAEKIDAMMQRRIDASFDAIFGDSVNPAPPAATGAGGEHAAAGASGGGTAAAPPAHAAHMPFSIGGNAKTESTYAFDVSTTMEFESTRRGAPDGKSIVQMYYNSKEPYSGTSIREADGKKPDGTVFIVLDARNQSMVMLLTDDKQKKASIAYDWSDAGKYAAGEHAAPSERVNWDTVSGWHGFTRIGTRTIAGYSADGYRGQSNESTVELWMSRDQRLMAGRMFGASANIKQMHGQLPPDFPEGMLLEMTGDNPKNGEKVTMRVTNIDTNARVAYVMADYPRMTYGKQ